MPRIYDQAALCSTGCCPVIDKDADGKLSISDPAYPAQGRFEFKDEAELATFLENAPKAFAAFKAKEA
jgi:hypothetical protein